jgi:hypothetical protein
VKTGQLVLQGRLLSARYWRQWAIHASGAIGMNIAFSVRQLVETFAINGI